MSFKLLSPTSKIFLILVIVQALALLGLGISVLVTGSQKHCSETTEDSCDITWKVYSIVYIYATFYFVTFAYDAVRNENTISMVFFFLTSLILFVFGGVRLNDPTIVTPKDWIFMSIFGAFELVYLVLLYRMYRSFGWAIFKKIGPDSQTRRMYKDYRAFCGFVKVTLMLDSIVLILGSSYFILRFQNWPEYECYTCIVEFVASFVVFIFCFLSYYLGLRGLRKQNKLVLIISQTLSFLICGYQVFRIIQFYLRDARETKMPSAVYFSIAGISMLFRVILLFFAVKCYKHFSNGFENVIDVTGKISMESRRSNRVLEGNPSDTFDQAVYNLLREDTDSIASQS